ncbi:MgtC/SapB family protein [Altererythrobacter arenosus]|uniref:MgtC/SapB family protein n=1 Tax=Altererythrobacter arenosus TaxID=3032592 RepID=A0ABY8FQJ9_9SPHN|nr:MgtC/SapB family protein [Altererythrobacter sp. CAU 1644]WFL77291.1 MgtC/SapB family protein [Altererythrobacter sp. CAU 1644]
MPALDQLLQIGSALAVGLLIGIERGWKLRDMAEGTRVAGIRTFTLLGLAAGLSGLMHASGQIIVPGAMIAGAVAIVVIGYARATNFEGRPDATSAAAAIVTLGLGYLGGSGEPALAVGGAAVVTLVLALRNELHGMVDALDRADVHAFARYAVIALAVFPFLPEGRYGPYDAWEPRTLWFVVVIVTGFSFVGYVANRLFGARRGTIATAIIGGAYSSTAVTHSFAQRLGAGEGGGAENAGIALATAVMYLRVIVLVTILASPLLAPFVVLVAPALVVGVGVSYWLYRRAEHSTGPAPPGNPIALLPALSFVAFVAAAAVAARWAQGRFGEEGIAILLLLMGSMDVDAAIVTAGGLEPGTIAPRLAALAIAGTILANMTVKLGVTLAYGKGNARPAAWALLASMVALSISLGLGYLNL